MNKKQFCLVAGAIFAVVAVVHLLRIALDWPVVIDGWAAPIWLSWLAVIGAAGLSAFGLRLAARR